MSRPSPARSSPSSTSDAVNRCHICGSSKVEKLPQDGTPFRLVSSDVQPADGAAEYLLCANCSAVQKAVTPQWQAMTDGIYANYDINHQSLGGAEPMVFDTAKGSGPRSLILLRNLLDKVDLPERGRLLDFGCSNGNLLKSFHGLRPAWKLSGQELFDTWRQTVMALPGVEAFYSGPTPSYDGTFDVIALSHVLEHLQDPAAFLKGIACRLSDHGRILIASPNLRQNPIDLIIADHCTHFEEQSLSYVIDKAGLTAELLSSRLLPKELVAVVAPRRGQGARPVQSGDSGPDAKERCLFYFGLLEEVRKAGRAAAAEKRPFGIMGSAIAACWMKLELEGAVDFFVDEDPDRVGHQLTGLPILAPAQVPPGSLVFIPMSVAVAEKIMGRWRDLPIDFRFVPSNRPV